MPYAMTSTEREALNAMGEALVESEGLQGETAWAYGLPDPAHHVRAVMLVTARGVVHFTWLSHGQPYQSSWNVAEDAAVKTVDDQLRMLQRATYWHHLFTLNECACEGDGRIWLSGHEQWLLENARDSSLERIGILTDEGRLYRRCPCGAGT